MPNGKTNPPTRKKVERISLLSVLYAVLGHLSVLPLVQNVIVTPAVFYPQGIAQAWALHYGRWIWPGVFVGQFALAVTLGLPVLPSLGIAAGNSLQTWLGVWLFQRCKLDARLEKPRDLAGLILLVFLVLQPVGGTVAHISLWLGGVIDTPMEFAVSWRNWWISGVLGQMLVTPMLLAIYAGQRRAGQVAVDAIIAMAVLIPTMVAAELLWERTGMASAIILLAPLMILIAIYRGLIAVCFGGIITAVATLFVTNSGWGPFVRGGDASIVDLNIFLVGLTLGGQFLAVFLRQQARQRETERELRDAREQLQRTAYELTENIPIGTYVLEFDAGGNPHFTFLSERYLAMTGLKREEVMANHALALQPMSPPDRSKIEQLNREVFASKKPFFWEGEITVRGEKRHVTLESTPRSRPAGGTIWEGVMTDITDRKKAEQQLRLALDNMPVAVAENTLTSPAEITYVNAQFTRTFGYTLDDVPTVADWAVKAYPDADYRREVFRRWDEAVFPAIEQCGTVDAMEFHVTCKDGSKRDIIFHAAALADRLLVTMTDVTEENKAIDAMLQAANSVKLAAAATGIGFWSRDIEKKIETWDDQMFRIYGVSRDEFEGCWEKFVHPEDLPRVMQIHEEAIAVGRAAAFEYRIIRPDGTQRYLRGLSARSSGDGEGAPTEMGVDIDITEEKEAALRAQKLIETHRRELETKLKTSLAAAAVAHEINQPLSTILLRSRMALEEKGDGLQALVEVAAEAKRVVTTIEKMKTLMRNVQTEHRAIDLGAVVRSALLYNKTMLLRRNVKVLETGLTQATMIMGDDEQLQLAITNILRNAAEAIDESASERREIAVGLAAKNNEVILTIGDSGPSWSGAELAETPLATTKKGGTGIGLYVARTAMENHRGKISFGKSALGGAEVKMIFPRAG